MKFFPFNIITYQLYLLQLELYEIRRYFKTLRLKGMFPGQSELRKALVWTPKALLIVGVAIVLDFALSFIIAAGLMMIFTASQLVFFIILTLLFLLLSFAYFFFYMIALMIIAPVDTFLKKRIIARARKKIREHKPIIIGIAGSYGKTTTKTVIHTLISENRNALKTPESINTPVGIARHALKEISKTTDAYVVEMGEYYKGDIKYLCSITPPSIALVTGINEAHLDRLKDINTAIATIFEIVEHSTPDALIILNIDDELVQKHYKKYMGKRTVLFYGAGKAHESVKNDYTTDYAIKNKTFLADGKGISFELHEKGRKEKPIGTFTLPFLGEYILGTIMAGLLVARALGLSNHEITSGIKKLKPIPHRLQLLTNPNDILIIDDSYNGNPAGAKEAITVLNRFTKRRKIYLTPGLVEMGTRAKHVHETIGQELSNVADLVILIKNTVTPDLSAGLQKNGFDKKNIMWFDSSKKAHQALGDILKPNDVILFQNDWTDNYG